MKTNLLATTLVAAALSAATALPSHADDRRRDRYDRHDRHERHDRHDRDDRHDKKPRISVNFITGTLFHRPPPRPVYVPPRRVVVTRPVVVQQPVYGVSVGVDVQRALARRGYYGGAIDGDIGPRSRAAIRSYQVDRGLPVTGRIDTPLLKSLGLL